MSEMEAEESAPVCAGKPEQPFQSVVHSAQEEEGINDNNQTEDNSISYEIEKIIGSKKDENGKVLYKARWIAHTWIPEDCLASFHHLIKEYWDEVETKKQTTADDSNVIELTSDISIKEIIEDTSEVQTSIAAASAATENQREDAVFTESADDVSYNNYDNLSNVDNVSSTTSKDDSTIYCPKCNQRFYLKSNLEVHVLFCKGQQKQSNESAANDAPATQGVSNEEMSDSQTFEYVPFDAATAQACASCLKRFPDSEVSGAALTDITQLIENSQKNIISDKVEVYECNECKRNFLFAYPTGKPDAGSEIKKCKSAAKTYKCSICNRSFVEENEMLEHEVKHANTASRYACATCNEKFVTRDLLQKHYDNTDNLCKPRKCKICGRTFIHLNHLKRHLTIHAGIKPFSCTICGHEFNQKSDLYRHEKLHTVDGKLTCSKCAQTFSSIEELREHAKTHTAKSGEDSKSSFPCDRCGKTFGRKSHLKRHLSVHDGLKPYACDQCGKSFNQRTDLKRHLMSHMRRELKAKGVEKSREKVAMSESDIVCTICNKAFPTRAAYLVHSLSHQKIMNTGALY
ncbi:zinc finger protein 569-like [Hydractinia symbiolongicarpus]|uniref:zinc finger protein 569-like n=1 Tax=Hydractinia symbiolongicarpus TaxID=13093 RepID=UPI00254B519D|nr:zinc finger protein 569-like [Hydractinia symbiolongicarpus]